MSKSGWKLVWAAAIVLLGTLTAMSVGAQQPTDVAPPAGLPAGHPPMPGGPGAMPALPPGHPGVPGVLPPEALSGDAAPALPGAVPAIPPTPPGPRPSAGLSGQIELRIPGVAAGPLEMVWKGDAYEGTFEIHNTGVGPLNVTRVAPLQSDDAPVPAGVTVGFSDNARTAVIPPNGSKTVQVRWVPGKAPLVKELYAQVVVESDSRDHAPVAMGIHAEMPLGGAPWLFNHILSWMTFLPLLGMLGIFVLYLIGYKKDENIKWGVVGLMGVNLALGIWLFLSYNRAVGRLAGNDGFQFIERGVWIRSLNVEYFVGVDGTSITMVLLTALVSFVASIASFSVTKQLKGYWAMFCLLVTGMMGVFVALDLFLFYVFWEVMLLPMYFLIGIWGGPRKEYAAIKFFLYTLAGSVFMLLAFIALYYNGPSAHLVDGTTVAHTFSIPALSTAGPGYYSELTILGMSFVKVVWVVLFIGFAIKVPMFPFHTWLPDAHVEAPTAISVILAGVLLKMGTYGMLRINFPLLPDATQWAAPAIAVFGVINMVYGAFCAMAQEDLKRLVAYSSISHMGFCLLGMGAMTPAGIEASIVQMFNHGTITSMLFTLVGVIYDRAHTRDISRYGGMATEMPLYTAFFGFAFMASLGLPGLSGFIGEALTFVGAFPVYPALTIIGATSVIFTAGYHLWAMQRVFLGKFKEEWRRSHALEPFGGKFPEMNLREAMSLAPMAIIVFILGFWPRPLLDLIDSGVMDLTAYVNPSGASQIGSASDFVMRALAQLP
jgi:NADH-quinone oxidoreductase subunit M